MYTFIYTYLLVLIIENVSKEVIFCYENYILYFLVTMLAKLCENIVVMVS